MAVLWIFYLRESSFYPMQLWGECVMTSEKLESLPKVTRHTHSERSHGARDKKREKLYMRMEGDFFASILLMKRAI